MKILIYAVLSRDRFCRKFTHFFIVQFSKASECVGVQKWTNMRYVYASNIVYTNVKYIDYNTRIHNLLIWLTIFNLLNQFDIWRKCGMIVNWQLCNELRLWGGMLTSPSSRFWAWEAPGAGKWFWSCGAIDGTWRDREIGETMSKHCW